ncbi:MAG: MFS transporter [Tyzzerella sp.]|nr:MFS transporter [Tyzzerella sp.]
MTIFKTKDAKNAFYIGAICVLGYVACYFAKNLLGVVSPYMIEEGFYDIQYIGLLSTSNMLFYAVGQLANGIIGDRIKSKYMIGFGLTFSGICYLIMAFSDVRMLVTAVYSLSGFFLSMLYAPMMKVIAENTRPIHAIRCSLGLTFASLTGTPIVGILAIVFRWNMVFVVCGFTLIFIGVLSFICFHRFEKSGIIQYKQIQKTSEKGGGIKILLQHAIIKFSFVAILTGIVRTSVVFWIPTYLSQYLELSSASATTIFTVMSIAQAVTPYVSMVLLYDKLLKRNVNVMLIVTFASSALSFLMMYIVSNGAVNILFFFLAILTANGASCALWNAYCPSLKDTGMVSTATGYLDFLSYAAAALANQLFANAVSDIGWGNLILVWGALMLAGVLVAAPIRKK